MKRSPSLQEAAIILPSNENVSGRTLGDEEITLLTVAIRSGMLARTKGAFVKALEKRFAEIIGVRFAIACSSGTAAIHSAIAAIDPSPGDEIITTSITDMGALMPIIYQSAIPVFADVDPETCNVTANTIEARLSERTRAIIVTHMFGNPCDMTEIMRLAESHNIPVIEDCSHSYLSRHQGAITGSIGAIGCFSLYQGNHITTGEGGLITTNDETLARRMAMFGNKGGGQKEAETNHSFLALNYRMTELQGAVAVAQLPKLDAVVQSRIAAANKLTWRLKSLPGIEPPNVGPKNLQTYWKYCLRVDGQAISDGAAGLDRLLREKGILPATACLTEPAFMSEIFQKQRTFGDSRFPFTLARPEAVNYEPSNFNGTFEAVYSFLALPWNEHYRDDHIDYIADSIQNAVEQLQL